MKFPEDIRYAHRIWMSMVLVTPVLHNFLLILFGKIAIDAIVVDYVFTVFKHGIVLIIYWAVLLILVLTVNSWNYTINTKKWIIQLTDILLLVCFFSGLVLFSSEIRDLHLLLLALSYLLVSSSAIWFFKLPDRKTKDDFEIIEHLIDQ